MNTSVFPETVNIEGPAAELEKIDRAEITAEITTPLDRTYSGDFPIVFYDHSGNVIDPAELHVNADAEEARLMIQVLKLKNVPLVFDYMPTPLGFPLKELELRVRLSLDNVTIAGPADIIDRTDNITLGYIDVKDITPENTTFPFDVRLPSPEDAFTRIDNITSVAVNVNLSGLESARFNVTELRPIGLPLGYEAEVLAQTIPNVRFVGRTEILQSMTAEDIVAEVDFSEREILSGSYTCPVKISVPGKGLVWAVGDHTVTVQVSEIEAEEAGAEGEGDEAAE
jgi:YbbR domain-containing protein